MIPRQTIAILDFGSQTAQLIARRVRENHVYCELLAPETPPAELRAMNVRGVILSGGPASVYEERAPQCDPHLLELGVPVLGICYGMQALCRLLGSRVSAAPVREFGRARLHIGRAEGILASLPAETTVWMSHGDAVLDAGEAFESLASTESCPIAAVRHRTRPLFGVQFHPEVTHTPLGSRILRNFLYSVCGCTGDWQTPAAIDEAVERIRREVGAQAKVICGLSGGVDSSVTAALLQRAIGDRLACIFVDHGLLRQNEGRLVEETFGRHFGMRLQIADARREFLGALAGVSDPQEKRTIIGREFIAAFRREAERIEGARFLAQGTIYPDVIESGHGRTQHSAVIKAHHNVGGLPRELGFELVEPLRMMFKDEVRYVGEALGLPEDLVWRHPFPGPGLAVRIAGEVTEERLAILRTCDEILLEELTAAGWYRRVAQAFAALLPVPSVAVKGDARSYEGSYSVALRIVETSDFMTADWVHVDPTVLGAVSSRILNEVREVNRVLYDISSKPPATIEWQ